MPARNQKEKSKAKVSNIEQFYTVRPFLQTMEAYRTQHEHRQPNKRIEIQSPVILHKLNERLQANAQNELKEITKKRRNTPKTVSKLKIRNETIKLKKMQLAVALESMKKSENKQLEHVGLYDVDPTDRISTDYEKMLNIRQSWLRESKSMPTNLASHSMSSTQSAVFPIEKPSTKVLSHADPTEPDRLNTYLSSKILESDSESETEKLENFVPIDDDRKSLLLDSATMPEHVAANSNNIERSIGLSIENPSALVLKISDPTEPVALSYVSHKKTRKPREKSEKSKNTENKLSVDKSMKREAV